MSCRLQRAGQLTSLQLYAPRVQHCLRQFFRHKPSSGVTSSSELPNTCKQTLMVKIDENSLGQNFMEPFPFPLSFLFMQNYGIEAKLCSGNIIVCEEEEGLTGELL